MSAAVELRDVFRVRSIPQYPLRNPESQRATFGQPGLKLGVAPGAFQFTRGGSGFSRLDQNKLLHASPGAGVPSPPCLT